MYEEGATDLIKYLENAEYNETDMWKMLRHIKRRDRLRGTNLLKVFLNGKNIMKLVTVRIGEKYGLNTKVFESAPDYEFMGKGPIQECDVTVEQMYGMSLDIDEPIWLWILIYFS